MTSEKWGLDLACHSESLVTYQTFLYPSQIYLLIGFSRWGEWMDAQRDQRIFVKGQKNRLHFNKKKQNPVAVVVSADLSSEIEISDLSEQELRR